VKQNQDEYARKERSKINLNNMEEVSKYPLAAYGLRKVYKNGKIAVKGMDLLI
jgi:hypothetical protein